MCDYWEYKEFEQANWRQVNLVRNRRCDTTLYNQSDCEQTGHYETNMNELNESSNIKPYFIILFAMFIFVLFFN